MLKIKTETLFLYAHKICVMIKNKITACIILSYLLISCSFHSKRNSYNQISGWQMAPFSKQDSVNPILHPADSGVFFDSILHSLVHWEAKDVFNPAAIVKDGKVYLLYRAQDNLEIVKGGTSRIGLAISKDGLHFTTLIHPVFYPQMDSMRKYEWPGGTEDPRIVMRQDSLYIMTYTAYDGKMARLCLATSHDLLHWNKCGLVFGDKYKNLWSKSGAILCEKKGDQLIAKKVNGKYWMYWGDTNIFICTSNDLIHWQPILDSNGQMFILMKPRKNYFDSRLVETGPFALYTSKGILFIYNSMNASHQGDTSLPAGAYSPGQVLIDKNNPTKVIQRCHTYFMKPEKPYEINGQVGKVCFAEGLVFFKGKWFLYYGTADSKIAVAEYNP
jgi:beta-1,2-mannosidase